MKNIISILVALIIGFIVGYIWKPQEIRETTITRVDTLVIEKPIPYEKEIVRKVSVPIYVPTPADTVVVARADSVLVEVPIEVERREYKSEEYRAIVSGAIVGNIHPTLEEIDIYTRDETRIIEKPSPLFRPFISACGSKELLGIGAGVSIKDRVDVDVKYMRVGNDNMVVFGANYRFNIKGK